MVRSVDVEASLADVAWLRSLARQLVRDADQAEDLAQETWLSALRQPHGRIQDLRAWLVTTLRNSLRQLWRSQRRAESLQRAIPPRQHESGADELVATLHEQQALLAAVEQLPELSRTAILLRYSEGLPPRAIARRLGLPVATVQTRLKRGLQRLREDLDAGHGDRRAWLLPLGSWSKRPSLVLPLGGGLLLMQSSSKLLVAVVLLVSTVVLCWPSAPPSRSTPGQGLTAPSVVPAVAIAPAVGDGELPERVAAGGSAARAPDAASVAAVASRDVVGRVMQLDGSPLPAVVIARVGGDERATSGADGSFRLSMSGGGGQLQIDDPQWTTLFLGDADVGATAERIIVGARRHALRGVVVDEDERAVADADVRIWLPPQLRAALPLVLDFSGPRYWSLRTGVDGAFEFQDCARLPGVDVQVHKAGHVPARHALADGMDGVRITLRRHAAGDTAVTGCVLDRAGGLVADAIVAAGGAATVTDGRGEFVLPREQIRAGADLLALRHGCVPARAAVPTDGSYVVLQLGDAARTLAGVVVDERGKPLSDCKVWVADPTCFGRVDERLVTAEGVVGGGATRADLERVWQKFGNSSDEPPADQIPPDRQWRFARTDANGAFELPGLLDRPYQLRAMVERTLLMADFGPYAAGTRDLRLVLPTTAAHARLRGQVVDSRGVGVPAVRVRIAVEVLKIGTDESFVSRGQSRRSVVADADGRFELSDVPHACRLVVEGDAIETTEFRLARPGAAADPAVEPTPVRIVVPLRCHFRVELADPATADGFELLDADGKVMNIVRIEGSSRYFGQREQLHDGRTPVLNAGEGARRLVLRLGDAIVRTVDVLIEPGAVRVISL